MPTPRKASRGELDASAPIANDAPPPLGSAYARLLAHFGHRGWWPGETSFEICVGAILVQNTAWKNVERALDNLRGESLLDPLALYRVATDRLEILLRPSGFFRVKAARLKAFVTVLVEEYGGSLGRMLEGPVASVRSRLLGVPGIGPETADCLLLYAGEQPSFVIDAYTRRVLSRHGWADATAGYAELQHRCGQGLPEADPAKRVALWQDFHAQMVAVGQHFCRRSRALCETCPLAALLPGNRLELAAALR